MKAAAAAMVAVLGLGASLPPAAAAPAKSTLGCLAFMEGFVRWTAGHRIAFERPLNITRGFGGDDGDLDVRVLSTGADDVEGTLKCKGDAFRRFEVRIGVPADEGVIGAFKDYQEATLQAAFGFDKAKAQSIVRALSSDADEYLRASVQRGDTSVSGKVEYHQGDALDLGLIWTDEDHTLIVTVQDE